MIKRKRINVTARDIATYGNRDVLKPYNALLGCAVALAIQRHKDIKLSSVGFVFVNGENIIDNVLPEFVTENIIEMCSRRIVAPFHFYLRIEV